MSKGICSVLFDRDGTLVEDVPYNGDPERVVPVRDARATLDRLRAAGVRVGVLTNQSGVGRGLISLEQMRMVNARVDALLGPFDGWYICEHAPDDACECRKPKPKLVLDAARDWNIDPACIAVVGDKESDVEAARNAGATGIKIDATHSLADAAASILRGR